MNFNKYLIIILLLLIINILLYVFISENVPPNNNVVDNVNSRNTIPDSSMDAGEYKFNMYYTKWCSYSQKAKPGFIDLKNHLSKNHQSNTTSIKVNLIDVEDASNTNQIKKDLKDLKIESYPTILLLNGNTRLITKYTDKRNLKSYVNFLNTNIPNVNLPFNS
jgi:thiol-disulfide isomerase/thioredoxin